MITTSISSSLCVRACVLAHFQGLVFHFHDQLLLLFLAGSRFLKLGFDAADLYLVLHHCDQQTPGEGFSQDKKTHYKAHRIEDTIVVVVAVCIH